jgi:signal transduction histidine kinase/CheY-like chemotaxis protein
MAAATAPVKPASMRRGAQRLARLIAKLAGSIAGIFRAPAGDAYDAEVEKAFQREVLAKVFIPLQTALLLGALAFVGIALLDIGTAGIRPADASIRGLTVAGLLGLRRFLSAFPERSQPFLPAVALLGACLSSLGVLAILGMSGSPAVYPEIWLGALPIYFFTYGQLVMSIALAVTFSVGMMFAILLAGYSIGVPLAELGASLLFLLAANAFGAFTRRELERYARASFDEKLRAERAAREKNLFLRQSSHNLRQPLQAINSYSTVLEEAVARGDHERVRLLVGKLAASIDGLSHSFNRILDISNLESGRQTLELAPVCLNSLLESLENQFSPAAACKGLKLKVVLRARPPFALHTDENVLRQVLCNLLDNAIKYTPKGWILVRTAKAPGGLLRLDIRDTGVGIPEAHRADIFKEFFRGNKRRNDLQVKGLGIGLSYVARAVGKLHGHRLGFTSRVGAGTRFYLEIPASPANPASCVTNCRIAPEAIRGLYVFLVDDDEEVLEALGEQLSCWECLVEKIGSLAELKQALQDNLRPPDLVITDFRMENGETALDVMACIAADCGAAPTLVLTGQTLSAHEKKALGPAVALLRKPVDDETLLHRMQSALSGERPETS